jgi:predicted transposase YdaD
MALFDINQEPIMNKTVQARRHKEFTEEEYDLIWQMINEMGRALKEMPVFQQLLAARAEAKREGALEGRQEGRQEGWAEANRAILSKACLLHGGKERTATKIANASPEQLETWLDQLIAGEKFEEIFRGGSP